MIVAVEKRNAVGQRSILCPKLSQQAGIWVKIFQDNLNHCAARDYSPSAFFTVDFSRKLRMGKMKAVQALTFLLMGMDGNKDIV